MIVKKFNLVLLKIAKHFSGYGYAFIKHNFETDVDNNFTKGMQTMNKHFSIHTIQQKDGYIANFDPVSSLCNFSSTAQ